MAQTGFSEQTGTAFAISAIGAGAGIGVVVWLNAGTAARNKSFSHVFIGTLPERSSLPYHFQEKLLLAPPLVANLGSSRGRVSPSLELRSCPVDEFEEDRGPLYGGTVKTTLLMLIILACICGAIYFY